MAAEPLALRKIELKCAVAGGAMTRFISEAEQQLRAGIARDGKPYRVRGPFFRQPRTAARVAKITKFPQFFRCRFSTLVTRRGTLAAPSGAQWQARRMQPSTIVQFRGGHKKWARQSELQFSGSP